MTREQVEALIERRNAAWAARDPAALAATHTPDGTVYSPIGGHLKGRAEIERVYRVWLTAFPDVFWQQEEVVIDGDRAVVLGEDDWHARRGILRSAGGGTSRRGGGLDRGEDRGGPGRDRTPDLRVHRSAGADGRPQSQTRQLTPACQVGVRARPAIRATRRLPLEHLHQADLRLEDVGGPLLVGRQRVAEAGGDEHIAPIGRRPVDRRRGACRGPPHSASTPRSGSAPGRPRPACRRTGGWSRTPPPAAAAHATASSASNRRSTRRIVLSVSGWLLRLMSLRYEPLFLSVLSLSRKLTPLVIHGCAGSPFR